MILALFVAFLAAVVLLTGLPLLRPAPEEEAAVAVEAPADPGAAVDKVLSALNEVEYDYRMNKLSDEDYQELHTRYSRKAVDLIQELEQVESAEAEAAAEAEDEADLEAEVVAEILAAAEAQSPAPTLFCHHCGAKLMQPGQVYCQSCGLSLEVESV